MILRSENASLYENFYKYINFYGKNSQRRVKYIVDNDSKRDNNQNLVSYTKCECNNVIIMNETWLLLSVINNIFCLLVGPNGFFFLQTM